MKKKRKNVILYVVGLIVVMLATWLVLVHKPVRTLPEAPVELEEGLDLRARIRFATSWALNGESARAIRELSQVIASSTDDEITSYALVCRGIAKFYKEDYQGAISDYSEALRLRPGYIVAFCNRGTARDHSGDYKGAIRDYQKASESFPEHPLVTYAWARTLARRKLKQAMLNKLRTAINGNPELRQNAAEEVDFREYWNDPDFKKLISE